MWLQISPRFFHGMTKCEVGKERHFVVYKSHPITVSMQPTFKFQTRPTRNGRDSILFVNKPSTLWLRIFLCVQNCKHLWVLYAPSKRFMTNVNRIDVWPIWRFVCFRLMRGNFFADTVCAYLELWNSALFCESFWWIMCSAPLDTGTHANIFVYIAPRAKNLEKPLPLLIMFLTVSVFVLTVCFEFFVDYFLAVTF